MAQQKPCVICENEAKEFRSGAGGYFHAVECPRCGAFDYDTSLGPLRVASPDEMVRLSGWVREQNDMGVEYARITPEIKERTSQMRLPGLMDRATRALAVIARICGGQLDVLAVIDGPTDLELQGRTYSRDSQDIQTLLGILDGHGYVRAGGDVGVTVAGLLAAEALGASQSSSPQGFVAMNFDANE